MRFAADSSPFFLSCSLQTRLLRACAALAVAASLAACGGGDGAGSGGSAGSVGSSAKPDATAAEDNSTPVKKDDEVRYAP